MLTGCGGQTRIVISKPPAERLVCDALTSRPSLLPEYSIDWDDLATKVATAKQNASDALILAKSEHGKFVASVRSREGIVAGYIVAIEGNWFSCSNDLQFNKAFYNAQPE